MRSDARFPLGPQFVFAFVADGPRLTGFADGLAAIQIRDATQGKQQMTAALGVDGGKARFRQVQYRLME
jgi:hypothetical protein